MNNIGYVCLIGLLMSLFSFSGYEAGAHMSEETTKATSSAPKGIIYTCIATALTGFAYILALLYVSVDVDTVLNGNSN
jgi:amino acid transporter